MMFEWLGMKNNDQNSLRAAKILEETILNIVKSGIATKDIGGTMSTREFTSQVTKALSVN